jgi:UPF0755 protein
LLYRLIVAGFIAVTLFIATLATGKFWLNSTLDSPLNVPDQGQTVRVFEGGSLSQLSRQWAAEGVIDSPYALLLQNRLAGGYVIKKGEYQLAPGDSQRDLLNKLISGEVLQYSVTFPEGLTIKQWLERLRSDERLGDIELSESLVAESLNVAESQGLEGWFFPDTYSYTSEDDAFDVLIQAHKRMEDVLAEEWSSRAEGLPLETPYEALILASIVERETGLPEERGAIAGVFVRRLKQGMKLQTDPTVIYGMGERFKGNITRKNLREATLYNTYVIPGLPPTPIANPGREAIHAALNPEDGDALFFVARGDGSHQFSATLQEHRAAVREFQLQRKKHYRSSPQ